MQAGSCAPKVAALTGLTLPLLLHLSRLRGKPWRGCSRLCSPGQLVLLREGEVYYDFPVRRAGVKAVGALHARCLGTV